MSHTTAPMPAHPKLAMALAVCGEPNYVIAARAGVNPSTFSGVVSGRVHPTAAVRARIAAALGQGVGELFEATP